MVIKVEELLKKIIAIEKDAQQIVSEAREERDHFDKDIAAQVEQMENEITEQSARQISALEESQRASTREKVAQVHSQTEQKVREMDTLAEQNAENWAEQIFAKVLGR